MFIIVMVKHDYFELKALLALMTLSAVGWALFNLNGIKTNYDPTNVLHIELWTTSNCADTLIHC